MEQRQVTTSTKDDRELDARVAEICGWRHHGNRWWHESWPDIHNTVTFDKVPRYSTDIASAFLVVEKMREQNWYVEIGNGHERADKEWFVEFRRSDGKHLYTGEASDDSLAKAITLAALEAVKEK